MSKTCHAASSPACVPLPWHLGDPDVARLELPSHHRHGPGIAAGSWLIPGCACHDVGEPRHSTWAWLTGQGARQPRTVVAVAPQALSKAQARGRGCCPLSSGEELVPTRTHSGGLAVTPVTLHRANTLNQTSLFSKAQEERRACARERASPDQMSAEDMRDTPFGRHQGSLAPQDHTTSRLPVFSRLALVVLSISE